MTTAQLSAYRQADRNAYHQIAYRQYQADVPVAGLPTVSVQRAVANQIERVHAGNLGFANWAVY